MEKFASLIRAAVRARYSDVHITGGHPLVYRQDGTIKFDKRITWSPQEVDSLVKTMLNPYRLNMLRTRHSVDLAMSVSGTRIRVNVFNTSRGLSIAARLLAGKVPGLAELNIHPSINDFSKFKSGLILVCGATGAGKTATIAGILEQINRTRSGHVITLEDPIEFLFKSEKCFIEQRKLGAHFPTYERGLLDVLREDPDIIVVTELRETEAMRLTLDAAESGHLIISSMHAADVSECIYRFCNSFPMEVQDLVRYQLSTTLRGVIAQQLHFFENHGFRIPVLSILHSNSSVRGVITDNKLSQLENLMRMSLKQGMFTFDLYKSEYLDKQTRFNVPAWHISPSAEISTDEYYESPLLSAAPEEKGFSPDAYQAQEPREVRLEDKSTGSEVLRVQRTAQKTVHEKQDRVVHNIDEYGSMEEVIESLKHLDKL
jgi:twitching motility protein PilT